MLTNQSFHGLLLPPSKAKGQPPPSKQVEIEARSRLENSDTNPTWPKVKIPTEKTVNDRDQSRFGRRGISPVVVTPSIRLESQRSQSGNSKEGDEM